MVSRWNLQEGENAEQKKLKFILWVLRQVLRLLLFSQC